MKTIVNLENNVSLYLFEEEEQVLLNESITIVGEPPRFIIHDCNSNNSVIYRGLATPEDWVGWKYLVIEDQWVDNPEYLKK